jgi:hypothetical protein
MLKGVTMKEKGRKRNNKRNARENSELHAK